MMMMMIFFLNFYKTESCQFMEVREQTVCWQDGFMCEFNGQAQ